MEESSSLQSSAQTRSLAVEILMQRTMDTTQTQFEQIKKRLTSPSCGIEIVTSSETPLSSIVGLEEVKHEVVKSMQERGGFQRLLLFGACGSGKAELARGVANELQNGLINVTRVKALFEWEERLDTYNKVLAEICAEKCSQTKSFVLFLNHVDFYSVSSDDHAQALIRFLENVQMSWAKSGLKLAIVGTTFKPEVLSEAVVRCFNKRVYVPTPNSSERKALLLKEIPKVWKADHLLTEEDVDFVARQSFGIIASGVGTLITSACRVQSPNYDAGHDAQMEIQKPLLENMGYLNYRPLMKVTIPSALILNIELYYQSIFNCVSLNLGRF